MTPCMPATKFCTIVGHASFQTAGRMGPSTSERSNFGDFFGNTAADMNS